MPQVFRRVTSPFRPDDADLSPETKFQIQLYRFLTLLGTVLIPAYGLLYSPYNPLAADPVWARLGITGPFLGLLVASYWSEKIRRHYGSGLRGLLYVLVVWTILLAAVNHFSGDYVVGLLLVYASLIVVVGVGARRIRPVLWFAGSGLFLTALATTSARAPYTSPLVLIASMATIALVEGLAICAYLSIRERLRDRNARLQDLTDRGPGVVFQFAVRPDGSYQNTFVSDRAEALLGISPDPDGFYDRFVEHVPGPHREAFVESIDRAVEERRNAHFEVPFDRPEGTRLWLLWTSTPERREEELVLNGVILDVTEQKIAQ